jgi:hypothetical protein
MKQQFSSGIIVLLRRLKDKTHPVTTILLHPDGNIDDL